MLRRTLLVLGVSAGVALGTVTPASAGPHPGTLSLPRPSGPYQVGETELHLVDRSRPDPWRSGERELMVSVHYPAVHTAGTPTAPYMLPGAAEHFDAVTANQLLGLDTPPGVDWAGVRTNAARSAPVLPGRHHVLLYEPGLGEPRTWGTATAEDLASRGYVVVSVDHTYEAPEVQFPDGSVRTMVDPQAPGPFIRKALDVRVRDTRFVLDRLAALDAGGNPDAERRPLPAGLAGTLDLDGVGIVGHSMGGAVAALQLADPRVAAGVNLDGTLAYYDGSLLPPAEHGVDGPLLLLGKDGQTDTGPSWDAFLANTRCWARELKLLGSQHASFTDAEALLPQLGLSEAVLRKQLGDLEPATAIRTQRAYVAAFFDHFLRQRSGHLLAGPSPRYPDMEFVSSS